MGVRIVAIKNTYFPYDTRLYALYCSTTERPFAYSHRKYVLEKYLESCEERGIDPRTLPTKIIDKEIDDLSDSMPENEDEDNE